MTKIVKPFRLTLDDGSVMSFSPGEHDFSSLPGFPRDGKPATKDYSDHFFVRAHSDNPADGKPIPGSAQHVAAMRALAEKKQRELEEAQQALVEAEAEAVSQGNRLMEPFGKSVQISAAGDALGIVGTKLGPAAEGALRQLSPGQKGAGDMHSAMGGQIVGPAKRVADEADLSGIDEIDADAALAEQEARAASGGSRKRITLPDGAPEPAAEV